MTLKIRLAIALFFALIVGSLSIDTARRNLASSPEAYYGLLSTTMVLQQLRHGIGDFEHQHRRLPDQKEFGHIERLNSGDRDFWGNMLIYTPSGQHYTLESLGRNGKPGGRWEDTDLIIDDLGKPHYTIYLTWSDFTSSGQLWESAKYAFPTCLLTFAIVCIGTRRSSRLSLGHAIAFLIIGAAAVVVTGPMIVLHLLPPDH